MSMDLTWRHVRSDDRLLRVAERRFRYYCREIVRKNVRFPPGHLVVPHDHAVGIGITRFRVGKIGTVERHLVAGSGIDDIRQSRPEPRRVVRGCGRVVRPHAIGLQGIPRVELTRERDRPVVDHKLSAAVPEGDRNLHGYLVPGLQAQFVLPVYELADVAPVGIVQRILGIVQGLYAVLRYLTGERLDSRACPDGGAANRRMMEATVTWSPG